jgi:hypothetical protein
MNFDEALRAELITIPALNNKVFPLFAFKDTTEPYLVYRRGLVDFEKTLSGTSKSKIEANYELVLVTESYAELQKNSSDVVEKIVSFLDREIGDSGPHIRNLTLRITGDTYEPEIDKFRCDLELKVSY